MPLFSLIVVKLEKIGIIRQPLDGLNYRCRPNAAGDLPGWRIQERRCGWRGDQRAGPFPLPGPPANAARINTIDRPAEDREIQTSASASTDRFPCSLRTPRTQRRPPRRPRAPRHRPRSPDNRHPGCNRSTDRDCISPKGFPIHYYDRSSLHPTLDF